MNFKNDFKLWVKGRPRRPLFRAGLVLVLFLLQPRFPASEAACSCNSAVPPCESPFATAGNVSEASDSPNCPKTARADCPCCLVCAGQLGDPCGQSEPCDSSSSLVCLDGRCQKGKTCHFLALWHYEILRSFTSVMTQTRELGSHILRWDLVT